MGTSKIGALIFNIPIRAHHRATDHKHFRAVNVMALIGAVMFGGWALANVLGGQQAGQQWVALENAVFALGFGSVIFANRAGYHFGAAVAFLLLAHAQTVISIVWFGFASNSHLFYFVLIVAPYLAFTRRHRGLAHAFAALSFIGLFATFSQRDNLEPVFIFFGAEAQWASSVILGALSLAAIAYVFQRFIDRTEDDLLAEQERSQQLLLNVLPESIAERLKDDSSSVIADRFSSVSILFADIVGFTRLSTDTTPTETVKLLNTIFSEFDGICDRHGIEKIRTIGDGYMAIAGAPIEKPDHAVALARAAIEMRDFIANASLPHSVQVRIGLNTGEVVAGIVGRRRFHYDVWSDAVNVAARMESTGEPGRIQIADTFHELIRDVLPCTPRDPIEVKGKGLMRTWFLD
ncbi:MAG: adenylate/guanylate cyclase domain-containing protein [Proteobacteria bacterium]|nr:adenylate/guanylate cyclase domain-containing protein [Pseudomonadota bacterium]MDA1057590.1 adenylate/guanylate cyclase domain-containing protein [Pseudomonadota bacterium]